MPRLVFDFPTPAADRPDRPAPRRVYREPVEVVRAERVEGVRPALGRVERAVAEGLHAAGYLAYEAAPAFDAAYRVRSGCRLPLLWFGLYEGWEPQGAGEAAHPAEPAPPVDWTLRPPRDRFDRAIGTIREAIAAGRTYQVNFTGRMHGRIPPGPDAAGALYERLRAAQGRGYHAWLDLGDHQIVSASPELFFHREGDRLVTRPMKGTRPRGRWSGEDAARARELLDSPKERAENAMIVDLLRNDVGRLAAYGSVRVPRLMEVERYPTVLQMTSTVVGDVGADRPLVELFEALFPCGSVTGAPKVATMALIAELEEEPREVYCGAIGFVEPGGERNARCTFSVPIRTVWSETSTGRAVYGTGSGVTWDSVAAQEHEEMLSKAAVLRARPLPSFELFETLRLARPERPERTDPDPAAAAGWRPVRLERHLARMAASADYFGFRWDGRAVERALWDRVAEVEPSGEGDRRLRLTLAPSGAVEVEVLPLPPAPPREPAAFALSGEPVDSGDVLLFHKTTHRAMYDRRRAAHPDAFDVLLVNERDELTEFTRGNLVVEIGGRAWTPPRACGLLAGCLRDELIAAGEVVERVLRPDDLHRAEAVWFVNSLRGRISVRRTVGGASRTETRR